MIKRLLGIRNIEKFLKELSDKMGLHWGHTDNLYKLNKENRNRIEKIERELHKRTSDLKSIMEEVIYRLDKSTDVGIREPEKEEIKEKEFVPVADSDVIVLQILHQKACFDENSAITTSDIYDNLPFSITQRGLRKKLRTLLKQGIVETFKSKNKRKWYIRTGRISDVKRVLKEKERVKE
jgi:predicted HTH transcriptional regulator